MDIKPPTPEEYATLAAQQAHRFPEKYSIALPGNRGETVKIPIVLGIPTGACKMPLGERPSLAWANFIAAMFRVRDESVDLARQAASDCLLWPDAATWAQIVAKWPGAPDQVWEAARAKCGAALSLLGIPEKDEAPPAPVLAVLDKCDRSVWRRLDTDLVVVIEPPKPAPWAFFSDAMKKVDADRWKLVSEMAQIGVPAAFRVTPASLKEPEAKYDPVSFVEEVLVRRPGFAIHVALTQSQLAGLTARVDRDEW